MKGPNIPLLSARLSQGDTYYVTAIARSSACGVSLHTLPLPSPVKKVMHHFRTGRSIPQNSRTTLVTKPRQQNRPRRRLLFVQNIAPPAPSLQRFLPSPPTTRRGTYRQQSENKNRHARLEAPSVVSPKNVSAVRKEARTKQKTKNETQTKTPTKIEHTQYIVASCCKRAVQPLIG